MRSSSRARSLALLLPALALPGAAAALAEQPEVAAPKKISVTFRGPLKDSLRAIASKGGINLVVTGDLDQAAEVYLKDVSAEEALATVATAYQLKIHRQGSIWTLRPMTFAEQQAATPRPAMPQPPEPPTPPPPLRKLFDKIKLHRQGGNENEVVGTGPVVVASGQVVKNAVAYGGPLTISSGAVVEGDAVAFGGDVVLESGAVVEGDAVSFGGKVSKAEGAVLEGDEVSMGGDGLGAVVAKGKERTEARRDAGDRSDDDDEDDENGLVPSLQLSRQSGMPGLFLRFALLFGLGFLFMMFAPARMRQIESELRREPFKCGLTGLVGSIALIPLTVLLAVTVVGIPFAIALWILVGLGIAMGFAAIAAEIGLKLPFLRARKTQAVVLALGLAAMLLAAKVPVLGPIAMAVVSLIALGAIIRTRFGQRPKGFPEPEVSA